MAAGWTIDKKKTMKELEMQSIIKITAISTNGNTKVDMSMSGETEGTYIWYRTHI